MKHCKERSGIKHELLPVCKIREDRPAAVAFAADLEGWVAQVQQKGEVGEPWQRVLGHEQKLRSVTDH